MRLTKEQKGITLIALVITIIVLLILAGVALATLTGNSSIIDNANYAVTEYNKSAGNDQNVLNQVENLFAKYMGESSNPGDDDLPTYTITYNANGGSGTMDTETAATTATSTFTPPTGKQFKEWNTAADGSGTSYAAGATVPSDVTLYAIWYDPLISHGVQVGDYITYDPTLGVTNASLLNYTSYTGELRVKDGDDYIIYEPGDDYGTPEYGELFYHLVDQNGDVTMNGYTVESDVSGSGAYNTQYFTATGANTVWRVLDKDETTGTIKIIPNVPIKTTNDEYFMLNGFLGYKNAKTELDNISAIFGHGQGANATLTHGITTEEITNLTEYALPENPAVLNVTDLGKTWNVTYDPSESTDYESNDAKVNDMIFKNQYWVSQRVVSGYTDYGIRVHFNILQVFSSSIESSYVSDGSLATFYREQDSANWVGSLNWQESGVMPVVTLKSDVEFLGDGETNGSAEHPWIFQVTE